MYQRQLRPLNRRTGLRNQPTRIRSYREDSHKKAQKTQKGCSACESCAFLWLILSSPGGRGIYLPSAASCPTLTAPWQPQKCFWSSYVWRARLLLRSGKAIRRLAYREQPTVRRTCRRRHLELRMANPIYPVFGYRRGLSSMSHRA